MQNLYSPLPHFTKIIVLTITAYYHKYCTHNYRILPKILYSPLPHFFTKNIVLTITTFYQKYPNTLTPNIRLQNMKKKSILYL